MTVYLFRKENFDGGILELPGFDELVVAVKVREKFPSSLPDELLGKGVALAFLRFEGCNFSLDELFHWKNDGGRSRGEYMRMEIRAGHVYGQSVKVKRVKVEQFRIRNFYSSNK